MPLFHATLVDRLPSIHRHGLGGGDHEQLWEGCDRGVYLAADPGICIWIMLEHFLRFSDDSASPKEDLARIRIIVIDDSRYQASRLGPDPLIARGDVFLYQGVIDVQGMPILTIEDAIPQGEPQETSPEDDALFASMMRDVLDDRRARRS